MDCGGAGKIMEAQLGQPAPTPDPASGDRVNHQGNSGRVDTVSAELGALCHSPRDNGGRSSAEHCLEDGVGPQRDPRRKDTAVIPHDQGIDGAEQGGAAAEHDAEAHQPETGRTDTEVHQILHQDISRVFRPCKACLTHGEAGLHKEHQSCAY